MPSSGQPGASPRTCITPKTKSLLNSFEQCLQRIHRQVSRVARCFGQATYFFEQLFARQGARLGQSPSRRHLGQRGRACHGGNTPLCPKPNLHNTFGRDLRREFQNISARGIFNPDTRVRIANLSRISRVLKMIEHLRGIHSEFIVNSSAGVSPATQRRLSKSQALPPFKIFLSPAP